MITCTRTDYVTIGGTFDAVVAAVTHRASMPGVFPKRGHAYLKAYMRRFDRERAGGSLYDPASPCLTCLAGRVAEYLAP